MSEEAASREAARRRKRRSTIRRRLSLAIAIVVSLVIAVVILTKSRYLPSRVAKYVNTQYLADSPFEFSCGRISGNFLRRIVVKDPVLRYHGQNASFNVFRADEIAVEVRLLEAVHLNLAIDDLYMKNVRLQLRKDTEGHLVIPEGGGGDAEHVESAMEGSVTVDRFRVDGLQLFIGGEDRELAVRNVNLAGALSYREGIARVTVDQGTADVSGSQTSVSTLRLDATYDGSRLAVRDFNVRTGSSVVVANGAYHEGDLERVQLVFNPISLDELHGLGLIPDVHGEFGGNLVIGGALDSLQIDGSLTGAGLGVALSGMKVEGTLANNWLDLERIEGNVFGAYVSGRFRYSLGDEADYIFDGKCRNLDLTQGFVPDAGLPETDFNGELVLNYDASSDRYIIDATLDSLVFAGYRSGHTRFRGDWWDPVGLTIDELNLERPGYRAEGMGTISNEGALDIVVSARGDDFQYLWDYLQVPPVVGSYSVTGRFSGSVTDAQINLNGDATGVEFLFARVDTATVNAEVKGVGTLDPRVKLRVEGAHLGIGNQQFDDPVMYTEVDSGLVSVRELTFARGDTTVVTSFDVVADDRAATIGVKRVSLRIHEDTWELERPTQVLWNDGVVDVDTLQLSSARGRVGASLEYDEVGDRIDLTAWGQEVDLALLADAAGSRGRFGGTGDFLLDARGNVTRPLVNLSVSLSQCHFDSVSVDHLLGDLSYDGTGYQAQRMRFIADGDTLSLSGEWGCPVSPIEWAREGLDSALAANSSIQARAIARHFPIARVVRLFDDRKLFRDAFTGAIDIAGSAASPTVRVNGRVVPRAGPGYGLPAATVAMRYQDNSLIVERLEGLGDFDAIVTGQIPMTLSFVDGVDVRRDTPLRATVRIEPSDLRRIEPYFASIMVLRGRVEGSVDLTGTIDAPLLNGDVRVSNGELQLTDMYERFREINATVSLRGREVLLSSLEARSGKEGTVSASGKVNLVGFRPTDYQVDVALREMWITSIPDFASRQTGNLSIRSTDRPDGVRIPHITGQLEVTEATIYYDPAASATGRTSIMTPTEAPGWTCYVDLVGHNNIWIRSADLNVELGGALILVRDRSGLYLRGDLNVLRGSYLIYANKFRIIDGSLNFSTATLRPGIYINAYTPHREDNGVEKRIYLALNWQQDQKEPDIQLSYDDAGYSQDDLYRMLGGTSLGTGVATTALERIINQQMTGVDISIDQRQIGDGTLLGTSEQEMIIGVGKYLWQDVYMRYRQGLTWSSEQELQVEYRLSNLFLLRSEFIRNSRRGYQGRSGNLSDEFNLDVKFRWEF